MKKWFILLFSLAVTPYSFGQQPSQKQRVITVKSGAWFTLDASGTTDPDGDSLSYLWFNYPEAGSFKEPVEIQGSENIYHVNVVAPVVKKKETMHFILKVTDKGTPALSRYKRVVVTVVP